jgi:exodeoxyribonuclease VII small subunit
MSEKDKEKGKELNYEQAFSELVGIVKALEDEEHTLEEAVTLFERGQALAKHCADLLEKTELRVNQLTEDGKLEEFPE